MRTMRVFSTDLAAGPGGSQLRGRRQSRMAEMYLRQSVSPLAGLNGRIRSQERVVLEARYTERQGKSFRPAAQIPYHTRRLRS